MWKESVLLFYKFVHYARNENSILLHNVNEQETVHILRYVVDLLNSVDCVGKQCFNIKLKILKIVF